MRYLYKIQYIWFTIYHSPKTYIKNVKEILSLSSCSYMLWKRSSSTTLLLFMKSTYKIKVASLLSLLSYIIFRSIFELIVHWDYLLRTVLYIQLSVLFVKCTFYSNFTAKASTIMFTIFTFEELIVLVFYQNTLANLSGVYNL